MRYTGSPQGRRPNGVQRGQIRLLGGLAGSREEVFASGKKPPTDCPVVPKRVSLTLCVVTFAGGTTPGKLTRSATVFCTPVLVQLGGVAVDASAVDSTDGD